MITHSAEKGPFSREPRAHKKGLTGTSSREILSAAMAHLSLKNIPEGRPVSIILRHAERDPIHNMSDPVSSLLTKQGMADSVSLGHKMTSLLPIRLFHSPLPRCMQTARGIFQGLTENGGAATLAGPINDLNGPYVTGDWMKISAMVEEEGQAAFIRRWFDGEVPGGLLMPLAEAARVQMKILADQLSGGSSSCVNVTHDWNIMIILEYYFELKHDIIGQPGYLDGICSFADGEDLILRYHDQEVSVPRA